MLGLLYRFGDGRVPDSIRSGYTLGNPISKGKAPYMNPNLLNFIERDIVKRNLDRYEAEWKA